MACKDFVEFLMDYLEGELPKAQQALFEEHLKVCSSCVAYLSNYRDTVELSRAAFCQPDGPVPEDVPEDLVAAVLAARKTGGR
jgi:predicted anti-sigma-YlaC factor YlaD